MALPLISTLWGGWKFARKIKRAYKEGKDVVAAAGVIRAKYDDLPDDVKLAWKEVEEFVDALRDIA